MKEKKISIRIYKKYARFHLENGATLKDIDKKTFEWLEKIFESEVVGDYNGAEDELTISNGITEIKIEKI